MWGRTRSTIDKAAKTGMEQSYDKNRENRLVQITRDNKPEARRHPGRKIG